MKTIIKKINIGIFLSSMMCLQNANAFGWIDPNIILEVSPEGLPYAQAIKRDGRYEISLGRFDSGCNMLYDDYYCHYPPREPLADYAATVYMNTKGGGTLTFVHAYKTYSTPGTDKATLYVLLPDGQKIYIYNEFSNPYKQGKRYSHSLGIQFDLDPWKYDENAKVELHMSVSNNGFGDQTQLSVKDLQVWGCDVIPLTTITDADALAFEAGNTINTEKLNDATKKGLNCMENEVKKAGGAFILSSAYRPVEYQAHLGDVWKRNDDLKDFKQPLTYCSDLQTAVALEMSKHALIAQPADASPTAPHSAGNAFDATIWNLPSSKTVDMVVANSCGMYRRMPAEDPVHYEPKPK